ncbi:MAG: CTP synthase [Candidatus Babeliales bacterium]|nr:CTP synthase [Candidatus Babeliales bacterium]
MKNFIFITGGVLSSLGKGLTAGSIGALFEASGYKVSFIKLDPYLNVDPGTMSPYEHGEVFVTNDGLETDLDLGHYERFTNAVLNKDSNVTAGKLYSRLLEKERKGDLLGKTIQIVPHFTNAIKEAVYNVCHESDVTIVEVGGTIGDIEGLPFIEAIRQIGLEKKKNNSVYVHLTYLPYLKMADELKTKPTQHSVKTLLSMGIQPDILICRAEKELSEDIKKKISLFTNVEEQFVISAPDLNNIYSQPLVFAKQNLDKSLINFLNLDSRKSDLTNWTQITNTLATLENHVNIAMVGKYNECKDAYKSIYEALIHAQIPNNIKVNISCIDGEDLTAENVDSVLKSFDGILVPGGFGNRAVEGKILAAGYARRNKIPYFGICLGMQVAAIEFARNVLNLPQANSTEFDVNSIDPVITIIEEQKNITFKGATMRLGKYDCKVDTNSKVFAAYKTDMIDERHRHRYELNPKYIPALEQHGLHISGKNNVDDLTEIIEITDHPFFIACQFHPEFKSKPFAAHPIFVEFIGAAKRLNLI